MELLGFIFVWEAYEQADSGLEEIRSKGEGALLPEDFPRPCYNNSVDRVLRVTKAGLILACISVVESTVVSSTYAVDSVPGPAKPSADRNSTEAGEKVGFPSNQRLNKDLVNPLEPCSDASALKDFPQKNLSTSPAPAMSENGAEATSVEGDRSLQTSDRSDTESLRPCSTLSDHALPEPSHELSSLTDAVIDPVLTTTSAQSVAPPSQSQASPMLSPDASTAVARDAAAVIISSSTDDPATQLPKPSGSMSQKKGITVPELPNASQPGQAISER
jgi:hypothetical protein